MGYKGDIIALPNDLRTVFGGKLEKRVKIGGKRERIV